ncbi:MAG: hypothetical protein A2V70_11515 [Planctomycetes bacterium RBG_13_63_9]|nr:MAG: hypothetical protein A2V70_11515 [Planctomycetes bacterium RBG_13_63_9]
MDCHDTARFVLLLLWLLFLGVAILCPYRILCNPATSKLYRFSTVATGIIVVAVSYLLTFHFVYSANANTRVHGWPVPVVIFQRDAPDGPWWDYVGPTTVLAFPMNLVLLLGVWFFLLWLLNVAIARTKKRPAGMRRH